MTDIVKCTSCGGRSVVNLDCPHCHGTGKEPEASCRLMLDVLLAKVDSSNWDEGMKGEFFAGYKQAMDELHETVLEFQDMVYGDKACRDAWLNSVSNPKT